jgi:hypothetical protein
MHSLVALMQHLAGFPAQTVPTGNGGAALPSDVVDKLNTLLAWFKYGGFAGTIMGLIGAAVAMAISHRSGGGLGEHTRGIALAILAAIIIGASATIVGTFA